MNKVDMVGLAIKVKTLILETKIKVSTVMDVKDFIIIPKEEFITCDFLTRLMLVMGDDYLFYITSIPHLKIVIYDRSDDIEYEG